MSLSLCDGFQFNYHELTIGPDCFTFSWSYTRESCELPMTFTLLGFQVKQIMLNNFSVPSLMYNSSIPEFTLIKSQVLLHSLHYKVLGTNRNGGFCDESAYYNFTILLQNGNA